ncbi:MAG: peptide deformylase [Acidimicrobiales bacterium]
MTVFQIRAYGDPVLRQVTKQVDLFDEGLAKLAQDMLETMHEAEGVGLAANQIGVDRAIFVYDAGDGPVVMVNPRIIETSGEWSYEEGCLSVPGLHWPIVRPNRVHAKGHDLSGAEIEVWGEELEGRVLQHEMDHLNGRLLLEHLDPVQRREAMAALGARTLEKP